MLFYSYIIKKYYKPATSRLLNMRKPRPDDPVFLLFEEKKLEAADGCVPLAVSESFRQCQSE